MFGKAPQRGFSLIELLFIVMILGLLATIAIPSLVTARDAARRSEVVATLRTITNLQQNYYLKHGRYARLCPELAAANAALGVCDGPLLIHQSYELSMSPLAPSDEQLADSFSVLASGRAADGSLIVFLTDERGSINQILP
ncbi:MAG TPA: prepilin-type N-terminal cleavage/methylation domain-containing protein [Blastocatellia bacterium]|nr:prepilin-type N-terminal cleavage/methylation domain-containing protein [Blastocatellia bacterium]